MASARLVELQDAMKCTICWKFMMDLRVLSCGHTFCVKCLEILVRNDHIKCPTCETDIHLAATDVNALPKNVTMIQLITALNEQCMPVIITCSACDVLLSGIGKDEWSCSNCNNNLCSKCVRAHHEVKSFDHHELVSLATINGMKCSRHLKKEQTHICVDCGLAVCSICVLSHPQHQVEDAKKYLAECEQKLAAHWGQLGEAPAKWVAENVKDIDVEKVEVEVGQTFAKIQSEIDNAAQENIKKIREIQAQLQKKLATDRLLFSQLIDGMMEAKSLHSKIGELETLYKRKITPPQEALNNFNSLSKNINALIGQLRSNEMQLSSFNLMSIPKSFSASSFECTIGTIDRTTEIQPGLQIKMLDAPIYTIELKPDSNELGFYIRSICGSKHVGSKTAGKPAEKNGHLKEHDQILAVNDRNTSELTLEDVKKIIQSTTGTVTLTMKSCPGMGRTPYDYICLDV